MSPAVCRRDGYTTREPTASTGRVRRGNHRQYRPLNEEIPSENEGSSSENEGSSSESAGEIYMPESDSGDERTIERIEAHVLVENADQSTLKTLEESSRCPICLESWGASGNHRAVVTKCGHIYGERCIESWVNRSGDCPQCHARILTRDIRLIFPPVIFAAQARQNEPFGDEPSQRALVEEVLERSFTLGFAMRNCHGGARVYAQKVTDCLESYITPDTNVEQTFTVARYYGRLYDNTIEVCEASLRRFDRAVEALKASFEYSGE